MLRLRLALLVCLGTSCFGRPDVSHILLAQKAATAKMARQVGNFDLLLPGGPSLRLEEMQPAPFRKAGEQQGYDYAKPDISLPDNSLDVHPDSNLIKPVSTQAPEYLPPESEQQGSNIDNVIVSTTTTTTTTIAPPLDNLDAQQPFDENNGYGYQVPEQALSQTINEVIHEPSDINELATTTQATVSTTKRTSLEYLPPKPLPDLLGPRGPSTDRTETEPPKVEVQSTFVDVSTLSTQQPGTSQTTVSFSTAGFTSDNGKQPAVSISSEYSNPSTLAVSTTTEISSTAAPEYLPPDDLIIQSVPRSGISDAESTESESATASPAREQPTAEPSQPVTASQGPILDLLSTVQTTEEQPAEASTTSSEPQLVEPSMISLINQLSETNQIDPQDFNPMLRIEPVEAVELSIDQFTSTTAEPRTSTDEPCSVPASAATVLDLASTTAKDMITTYHPSSGGSVSQSNESTADGTEIQARIAPTDGYNYAVPDNGLDVPAVPSHTLDENGYHYKVPSVPFP